MFLHLLVDKHQFGAIPHEAAMNTSVQVFVWTQAFSSLD